MENIFVISIAIPVCLPTGYKANAKKRRLLIIFFKKWVLSGKRISTFLSNLLGRVTVVVVNLWVGIPYTMLVVTGILKNIPKELYEAAKVGGANPFVIFEK